MEKTREFYDTHLKPIVELERERLDPNILWNDPIHVYWNSLSFTTESVLEIGFGAGISAVYMLLSYPNIRITCIDEGFHRYTYPCYEKIRDFFGAERIQFYLGNSNLILPTLYPKKFDLIHYDGSDAEPVFEKDILYSYPLLHDSTICIFYKPHLVDLWKKYCQSFTFAPIDGIDSIYFRKRTSTSIPPVIRDSDIIPKKIHRIWQTELCDKMRFYSDRLQTEHPEFEYHLYTAKSAREFIREYFDTDVVDAYDSLIPFSYKADLFRYCVMFIHGGIYLDMKFECVNGFHFLEMIDREQYVLDIDENSIYNAFLICKPRSKIMFKCIFEVVKHVRERDYTADDLSVTGPGMMKQLVPKEIKAESNMRHVCMNYNKYILRNDIPILKNYHRYYEDTPKGGQPDYLHYWRNRKIYRDI